MGKKRKNPARGYQPPRGHRPQRSFLDEILDGFFEAFQTGRGIPDQDFDELPPSPRVSVSPLTPEENALYGEVVKLGFRKALETYHPDRGGDPDKMAKLNALRDKVFQIAGIKK